jgi:hypothetical protein
MADVRVRSKEELRRAIAEEERLQALSTKNSYKNREQYLLTELLSKVGDAATALVWSDFSYPPEDDASARQLLKTMPPRKHTLEQVLGQLDYLKTRHRAEGEGEFERFGRMQADIQAAQGKVP